MGHDQKVQAGGETKGLSVQAAHTAQCILKRSYLYMVAGVSWTYSHVFQQTTHLSFWSDTQSAFHRNCKLLARLQLQVLSCRWREPVGFSS